MSRLTTTIEQDQGGGYRQYITIVTSWADIGNGEPYDDRAAELLEQYHKGAVALARLSADERYIAERYLQRAAGDINDLEDAIAMATYVIDFAKDTAGALGLSRRTTRGGRSWPRPCSGPAGW
jgi:hypothetical protein